MAMEKLENLLKNSELSENQKQEVISALSAAKMEIEKDQPDRQQISDNIQNFQNVLDSTTGVIESGTNLWNATAPIVSKIISSLPSLF